MDSIIQQHCATILKQKQNISPTELKSLFDDIIIELNNYPMMDNYCQIVDTLKSVRALTMIDPLILNHELYHRLRDALSDILNKWRDDINSLTEREEYLFEQLDDLFLKMINHVKQTNGFPLSIFKTWFLNETFMKSIAQCLDDIALNGPKYIDDERNLRNFGLLIKSLQWFQSGNREIINNVDLLLLIKPITNCLSSKSYINLFKQLNIESDRRSAMEEFLLGTCPCYCAWYRGESQEHIMIRLCESNILQHYEDIYELFIKSIDNWEFAVMESIFLMTALLRYIAYYDVTRVYLKKNLEIIDYVLLLLSANCLLDNIQTTSNYNSQTNITDSAIALIYNLTVDPYFLSVIKENVHYSKDIFLKLKNAKVDRVKIHAYMILAKMMDEEDIKNLEDIGSVTSVFMDSLKKAVEDISHSYQDVPVEHLLACLKVFIQHDQVKDEILRQSYLPLLIKCASKPIFHVGLVLELSLEILWAITFNEEATLTLKNNHQHFLSYLKVNYINSTEPGVKAAARGILWKIETESATKNKIKDVTSCEDSDHKFDIMISYSHADKDLCFRVHDYLTKSNFRVWLDFENMYGSTLQSMASAIECSEIVLICMSNPYKQSAYCRSEAEYAYTRQRHIIPLVLQTKYRPDGWLGFICGSRMFVDFTKTDFEHAFEKLIGQIQLYRKQIAQAPPTLPQQQHHEQKLLPLISSDGPYLSRHSKDLNIRHSSEATIEIFTIEQTELVQESVAQNKNNSYEQRYIELWTHDDVLNFIDDTNLDTMRPLFQDKHMDGRSLYVLYRQCESNIESTYRLLKSQLRDDHNVDLPFVTYICFISALRYRRHPMSIARGIRHLSWTIQNKIEELFF